MHDRLFAHQKSLGPEALPGHAQAIGLNLPTFKQCLNSGKHATEIRKDISVGAKVGVRGTPTFLLGRTEGDGMKVKALQIIRGAQPYARFMQTIESLLNAKNP